MGTKKISPFNMFFMRTSIMDIYYFKILHHVFCAIVHSRLNSVIALNIRGGNRLHSQLPGECDYLQSTQVYGDYLLIIAINSSTL